MDLKQLLSDSITPVDPADVSGKTEPVSDTVLKVDRWGRRRGRELAEEWGGLDGAPKANENEAADALAALFDVKPQAATRPTDQQRAKWWQQLQETPEYRTLHARTTLSTTLSRLGAAALAQQWLEYAAEQPEPQAAAGPDGQEDLSGDGEEDLGRTIQRMRSTRQAAAQALDEVQTAEVVSASLGLGDASQLNMSELARYMASVRNNPVLRAIMQMAGRYIARARSLQRERLDAVRSDITGIELAGEIGRLLPCELMQVAGALPEIELLALYRLATRRTLAYKHSQRQRVGLGPIVVSVDESGSMSGDKIACAKGLALAMAWIARQQRRPFLLAGFEAGSEIYTTCFEDSADRLIDWCSHFYNGGTTLDGPCETMPYVMQEGLPQEAKGRTDHIIITDGYMSCPADLRDSYRKWATDNKVRTFGIVIGETQPGGIAEIADRFWCIPDLSLNQVAIETILSIGA